MITKQFHIDKAVTKREFSQSDLERSIQYTQEALFRQLGALIGEAMLKANAQLLTLTVKFNREEKTDQYSFSVVGVYNDDIIVYSVDGVAVLI